MLTVIREVGILPGKTAAARSLLVELTALARETTGAEFEAVRPVGGNPQRQGWCTRFKDLAAYDAAWAKLMAEPRFGQLMQKTPDIFVPGSMNEVIWQSI